MSYIVQRTIRERPEELARLERGHEPLRKTSPPSTDSATTRPWRSSGRTALTYQWGDDLGGDDEDHPHQAPRQARVR